VSSSRALRCVQLPALQHARGTLDGTRLANVLITRSVCPFRVHYYQKEDHAKATLEKLRACGSDGLFADMTAVLRNIHTRFKVC